MQMHWPTYRIRKFPVLYGGDDLVTEFLTPVPLFICDNWLALVRGKRGDGLPVPGRTGREHRTTFTTQHHHINALMAIKAFILYGTFSLLQSFRSE